MRLEDKIRKALESISKDIFTHGFAIEKILLNKGICTMEELSAAYSLAEDKYELLELKQHQEEAKSLLEFIAKQYKKEV